MSALDGRRWGIALAVTLAMSLRILIQPDLFDFFTLQDIVVAWLQHFLELALVATALTTAYTLTDEAIAPRSRARPVALVAVLLGVSVAGTAAIAWYVSGRLPPALHLASGSLRIAVPAVLLAAVNELFRRASRTDLALRDAQEARARFERDEAGRQLQLLQAQLEPHFLFNTLANVRRLCRTEPESGVRAIDNLMRYLRSALPQLRRETGALGEELELVRAYLELFQVRMGRRLTYAFECDPSVRDAEFPPMLLLTLVENAIKHGVEPAREGGRVAVRARARDGTLEVSVVDDGVGFGSAGTGGSGVGLANVRRQLTVLYGVDAHLQLDARSPRGVAATIVVPLRSRPWARQAPAAFAPT